MSASLASDIERARAAAQAVAVIDNERRLAGSLAALEAEQARLQRAAAIDSEVSAIVPSIQSSFDALAADAAQWRQRRDALTVEAQALAVAHREIENRRIAIEHQAGQTIAQLSARYPMSELGPAIVSIQSTLKAGRASAQTIVMEWHHAMSVSIDSVVSALARMVR